MESARLLYRRWTLLLSATVAAAALGVAATFFVPPVFESEVDLQVGTLNSDPYEDPQVLAKWLESAAFLNALSPATDAIRQPVRTQVVETRPGGPVAYIRIITRGGTPTVARDRASQVVTSVKTRHAALADNARGDAREYEQAVAETVAQLEQSLGKLDAAAAALPNATQDSRLATTFLQMQLDAKRSEFVRLSRELRDVRLKRSLGTRETRELAAPSLPLRPVWPARTVFAAVAGSFGFAVAAVAAILIR
jgi:uncharacterized protein involved in exopolysaccharide biosynthesis